MELRQLLSHLLGLVRLKHFLMLVAVLVVRCSIVQLQVAHTVLPYLLVQQQLDIPRIGKLQMTQTTVVRQVVV